MNFKWLSDWFEKIEPKGKWSWLGSTYEAFHTFAFTPKTVTKSGSHIRDAVDMKRSIGPTNATPMIVKITLTINVMTMVVSTAVCRLSLSFAP